MTGKPVLEPTRREWLATAGVIVATFALALLIWLLQDDWGRTLVIGVVATLIGGVAVVLILQGFARAAERSKSAPAESPRDLDPSQAAGALQLAGADLEGIRLRGANLAHADLAGARLTRADLTSARLERALLAGARLEEARLGEARMFYSDLEAAHLDRADLTGADLTGANLTRARLGGAVLCGARLSGAQLAGADLRRADLREAIVEGSAPEGVDKRGAIVDERTAKWLGVPLRRKDTENEPPKAG